MHARRPLAARPVRAAAAVLAAVAALAVTAHAAPAQVAGTKVGVVNVNVVSGKIQEMKDFAAHLHNQQELLDASQKGHQDQVNGMQQRLQQLKPDSDQFDDLVKQIQDTVAKFNMDDQLKKADLLREYNKYMKSLFLELQGVVADVAKRKGLDLVIVEPDVRLPTSVQTVNPEQLNNLIGQKTVLYASPNVDLTDDVAIAMDAQYKLHGGGGTPAPIH